MAKDHIDMRETIRTNARLSHATELAIKLIKDNAKDEEEITLLKAECLRLRQRESSYKEAVLEYESKIREITLKLKSSLTKEQERRKKAEQEVQKLQKQIEELELKLAQEKTDPL